MCVHINIYSHKIRLCIFIYFSVKKVVPKQQNERPPDRFVLALPLWMRLSLWKQRSTALARMRSVYWESFQNARNGGENGKPQIPAV